jgi:hypothetical protein
MTFFKTGAGDFQDRPGALHSTKKLWKNEKKKYIYMDSNTSMEHRRQLQKFTHEQAGTA